MTTGGFAPGQATVGMGPAANGQPQRPSAAPPNPKQQAVTFALELAKIRAGLPGAITGRATDVNLLIEDAKAIAAFIGTTAMAKAFGA